MLDLREEAQSLRLEEVVVQRAMVLRRRDIEDEELGKLEGRSWLGHRGWILQYGIVGATAKTSVTDSGNSSSIGGSERSVKVVDNGR